MYEIIESKCAAYYGIAACVSDICSAIIHNQRRVLPLSVYHQEYDICISVPVILGENGIEGTVNLEFHDGEKARFQESVKIVQEETKLLTKSTINFPILSSHPWISNFAALFSWALADAISYIPLADKITKTASDTGPIRMLHVKTRLRLSGPSSGAVACAAERLAQNLSTDDVMVIIFGDSGRAYLTKNFY